MNATPAQGPVLETLRVSLVQADTQWHDPLANHRLYGHLILPLQGQTDLVVLPETFTSGFTNQTQFHDERTQEAGIAWMREISQRCGAVVTGSMLTRIGGRHYNRLYWVEPDGSTSHYDKRHLFRYAGEHERYTAGDTRLVVTYRGWRVCPLICYDLRFPVFARNRFHPAPEHAPGEGQLEYDLLVVVANWPSVRHYAWQTLLRARAIENLCYAAGVNRVGTDGNQLYYAGGSAVLDPLGQAMVECGPQTQVVTTALRADALVAHRARFPFHRDADRFTLDP